MFRYHNTGIQVQYFGFFFWHALLIKLKQLLNVSCNQNLMKSYINFIDDGCIIYKCIIMEFPKTFTLQKLVYDIISILYTCTVPTTLFFTR